MPKRLQQIMYGALGAAVVASFLVVVPEIAHAQIDTDLQDFQQQTGLGNQDIKVTIAKIVRVLLGFLGIIAAVIVMWGGFIWMTANGNEDKIAKAKRILINAGVGLLIIMSAFTIVQFVITSFNDIGKGNSGSGSASGGISFGNSSALGTIIESHYPDRNAVDIPRNTPIMVTFKIPVEPASVMQAPAGKTTPLGTPQESGDSMIYDELRIEAVDIERLPSDDEIAADVAAAAGGDPIDPDKYKVTAVNVVMGADKKTFIFTPVDLLGSSLVDTHYQVTLTSEIKNTNGKSLFTLTEPDYDWEFMVNTVVDVTPPVVESTFPNMTTEKELPKNIAVSITFNEAIYPTAVSGKVVDGFNNIVIGAVTGDPDALSVTPVKGTYRITNGYRTVEFQADDPENFCGTNSCGKDVYCLPGESTIQVYTKAAALKNPGSDDPTGKYHPLVEPLGYHGVVDVVGNSMDGGGVNAGEVDGVASGPPADDFSFTFLTSGDKDLLPPQVVSLAPSIQQTKVDLTLDPVIGFSKPMMTSSFSDVMLGADPADFGVGFSKLFVDVALEAGSPVFDFYDTRSDFYLHHGTPMAENAVYAPYLPSTIMDAAYNCFLPAADDNLSACNGNGGPYCCNGNPQGTACELTP